MSQHSFFVDDAGPACELDLRYHHPHPHLQLLSWKTNHRQCLLWLGLKKARTLIRDLCLRAVFSLSRAEHGLAGSFMGGSRNPTFWKSALAALPSFLLAEESLAITVDLGSSLGFFSSLVFSATGSFSLVFALLQSSFPEGLGLSLDSVLGSGVVVEACFFLSKRRGLHSVDCCSVFTEAAALSGALAGTSKVALEEDAACVYVAPALSYKIFSVRKNTLGIVRSTRPLHAVP